MSTEHAWVIGLPSETTILALVEDAKSAAQRSAKADPGDRLDIARFETLATRLEHLAVNHPEGRRLAVAVPPPGQTMLFGQDPTTWPTSLPADIRAAAAALVDADLVPVLVITAHVPGSALAADVGAAEPPAEVWKADAGVFGGQAVEARFRAQIREALAADARRRNPISPSGISNTVVTEILREFVASIPGVSRVDAPVEYRDGSRSANPFPLRALPLREALPDASLELRLALLSIRHTEMDAVVHGAWLRNAEISRPRPAALTDDFVYDISRRQLHELCRGERHVRLHLFQTGLETAVVGFYRALTIHLLEHPGSVSVQPMYFVPPPSQKHMSRGRVRSRHGHSQPHHGGGDQDQKDGEDRSAQPSTTPSTHLHVTGVTGSSTFRKGTVWTS